jgi:hypothetical protein
MLLASSQLPSMPRARFAPKILDRKTESKRRERQTYPKRTPPCRLAGNGGLGMPDRRLALRPPSSENSSFPGQKNAPVLVEKEKTLGCVPRAFGSASAGLGWPSKSVGSNPTQEAADWLFNAGRGYWRVDSAFGNRHFFLAVTSDTVNTTIRIGSSTMR